MLLVSIDWDFFAYNGESESKITLPDGSSIPGIFLYDWGHSEERSIFGDILWTLRAANFKKYHGLDIEKEVSVREDLGSPSIQGFVEEIHKRFELSVKTLIADSHAHGAQAALRRAEQSYLVDKKPLDIVSFDAHHDLGYSQAQSDAIKYQQNVDAGSWLLGSLMLDFAANVQVVYPDWRGLWEWGDTERPWLERYRDRIELLTWSDWLARTRPKEPKERTAVFACRSSSWTPPWLDAQFCELVDLISNNGVECMDHTEHRVGAFDACTPRTWDGDEVDRLVETWKQHEASIESGVTQPSDRDTVGT